MEAIIIAHSSSDTKIEVRKAFKLMLNEDDVNSKIDELRDSTRSLWQLQSIGTSMRQIEATAPSKNSKKLTNSLISIQSYANRLYMILYQPGLLVVILPMRPD